MTLIADNWPDAAGNSGFTSDPLTSFFGTLVVLVLPTLISGRLLGIRLCWPRVLLAGVPGLVIGIAVVWALAGRHRSPSSLPVPAILQAALVATMLITVLLDLLARPGRLAAIEGRLHASRIPHPVRSLRSRVSHTRRYLGVTRIAARYGLASYLSGKTHLLATRPAGASPVGDQGATEPVT